MKPDWSEAPEWAKFAAADVDGEWYWYERKPKIYENKFWEARGRVNQISNLIGFESTLEPRP